MLWAQWDLPAFASPAAIPLADKNTKVDATLKGLPITELSTDEAVFHALNRLAYGPRPGDIDRVKQMGLAKWIDQQLNPRSISDSMVEARLTAFPTLAMNTAQLMQRYPDPKQAAKKAGISEEEFKAQQAAQKQADAGVASMLNEMYKQEKMAQLGSADAPSTMKQNPATTGAARKDSLSVDPNAVPRPIADDSKRPQRVVEELAMAKVTRAIYSDRQLQQVMDDFWLTTSTSTREKVK